MASLEKPSASTDVDTITSWYIADPTDVSPIPEHVAHAMERLKDYPVNEANKAVAHLSGMERARIEILLP